METLGERIVNARNRKGLSQEKFAEQLGVSRQMVSRWELNMAVPRMSRMEKICELLGLTANELINGKEGDELDKNQNNSQEPVAYKYLKFKAFMRRTALILLKVLLILITLYIAYTTFKLIVLKHVINKVSQYENYNNYYCKIKSFDESETESVREIWYKDGMYKTIETVKINDTDVKTTLIVDVNNKCRYQVDETNKIAKKRNLTQLDIYENGRLLYDSFPIEIINDFDYISTAFKINKVFYYKKDNKYYLEINDSKVYLNTETYLPNFMNTELKNKKETFNEYDIKLDVVQDEDIKIPNDYIIQ